MLSKPYLDHNYIIYTQSKKFPSFDNHVNKRSRTWITWTIFIVFIPNLTYAILGRGEVVFMIHNEYGKKEVWNLYHNISIGFCTRIASGFSCDPNWFQVLFGCSFLWWVTKFWVPLLEVSVSVSFLWMDDWENALELWIRGVRKLAMLWNRPPGKARYHLTESYPAAYPIQLAKLLTMGFFHYICSCEVFLHLVRLYLRWVHTWC